MPRRAAVSRTGRRVKARKPTPAPAQESASSGDVHDGAEERHEERTAEGGLDAGWVLSGWSPPHCEPPRGNTVPEGTRAPQPPQSCEPIDVLEAHRNFVRGCARIARDLSPGTKRDLCRALRTAGVTHDTLLVRTGASMGQVAALLVAQCPVRNRGARRRAPE